MTTYVLYADQPMSVLEQATSFSGMVSPATMSWGALSARG
jgi:hypothetical protein